MDVGARTDGLSCFRNVLVLQRQRGKRKNKVASGAGWRQHSNFTFQGPSVPVWEGGQRDRDERQGGRWREGKVCSIIPPPEINLSCLPGEEVKGPHSAIQEELIHDIHVPCFPPQNFIFISSLCTSPKCIIFYGGINGCLIIFGAWKFVWSIFSV